MKTTPFADLDKALDQLSERAQAWADLAIDGRIKIIDQLIVDVGNQAEPWVEAAIKAKGGPKLTVEGQEYVAGTFPVLRNLQFLRDTLHSLQDNGKVHLPGAVKTRKGGQVCLPVFPINTYDKLFFTGTRAEIWMQPEVTESNLEQHMATHYKKDVKGSISLVLGAGNVASIGPMDSFYKLFNEKKTVILKMHPVNDYLGPIFEKALKALIDPGYLQIVYGGADVGSYLCNHEKVNEIHITGSDKTHDAIVFGGDVEKGKADRSPTLTKPITSELGNVSGVIIVPGQWSESELDYQAENLASSLANNAGFNCNATRVIITHKDWPQRGTFLNKIRDVFKNLETRNSYYPGAQQRFEAFLKEHPDAEQFGSRTDKALPWTMIPNLDPSKQDDICYSTEAFCSLFAETALEADSPADFLAKATDFANNQLWGTLNVSIFIHPKNQKDAATAAALDQALTDLKFGTIAINHWAAIGYALVSPTWGAYPGHDIYDIQSGLDVVHNTFMVEKAEKSVIWGPFIIKPKPMWFVTHKKAHKLAKKLTDFEVSRSVLKLPGIFANALGG